MANYLLTNLEQKSSSVGISVLFNFNLMLKTWRYGHSFTQSANLEGTDILALFQMP